MANIEDCPGFETFGTDVKAARNAKHLSRKTLAEIINIDSRYLANIENEGTIPSYHTAYQSMWTSRGTVLQSRDYAGGKRTETAYQPQTETLSRAVFDRHRRCA